jgi:hypothetical protein
VKAFGGVGQHDVEGPVGGDLLDDMGRACRHRDHDLKVWVLLLQKENGFLEDRERAAGLEIAAAGYDQESGSVGRNIVSRPEGRAVGSLDVAFDGGVADIGARDSRIRKEGNLEGQQRHQVVYAPRELAGAAGAPRPKLRRNVMDDGDAGGTQAPRHAKREARRINSYYGVGLEAARGSEGYGIGLRNVRERLDSAYGSDAFVTTEERDGRFVVTLEMPSNE